MQVAVEVFKRLDIPITLRWNNRQYLGEVLESIGVSSEEKLSVMLTLDKIEKIGNDLIEMDNPTFEQISNKYGIQHSKGSFEATGLSQPVIARIENGHYLPEYKTVMKILIALEALQANFNEQAAASSPFVHI